ncbi:GTPase RhebL1 [Catharus ustulatus]|uniref:GTPase RhebL1 n=1 Tax=Catharus ustulatus TaxID=91951 RepID=UPI00140D9981|nr:GTPase RhebL1 [Catharus ustulatus]
MRDHHVATALPSVFMNGEPVRPTHMRDWEAPPPPPGSANGSARAVLWSRAAAGVVAAAPPPGTAGAFIAPFAAPARAFPRVVPPVRARKVLILGYRKGVPVFLSGSIPYRGVKPGPPSGVVFPHPGKISLAHQFVLEKFVQCYEPGRMVVVGKAEFHGWAGNAGAIWGVWGCRGDAGLPGTPATSFVLPPHHQDEYTILPHSIITIHGYILVCLVTSLRSFQVFQTLHNELHKSQGAVPPREGAQGDEGKKLVESFGAIFLESSAKESQVWGAEPTRRWKEGSQRAGTDVPLSSGIFVKLTEENDEVDNSYGRSTCCHRM